jgi:hypothetical protein
MKSINKRLMKIKHERKLEHYKEKRQENDLENHDALMNGKCLFL